MRTLAPLALLLLLVPTAAGHPSPDSPHSISVLDVQHFPSAPRRGVPLDVELIVEAGPDIVVARLIYCRVERYACGPAINMSHPYPTKFIGRIPWTPQFFEGVSRVGYQFELRHANGTIEHSPLKDVPDRPAQLPAEATPYYFYDLPAPAESPAPGGLWLIAVGVLAALGRRGRG